MHSIFDLELQHADVDSKIAAALERLAQAFRVLLWEQAKAHNLSPIQIQILVYLLYHSSSPQRTMGHIAREFTLTPATVSAAVQVLETKRLLRRTALPKDRRVSVVTLTPTGRKLARQLSTWANVMQAHVGALDDSKKLIVQDFLMQLIDALQRAGIISVARMCLSCKFFQPDVHPDRAEPHHCQLMDRPLGAATLRLDCPEHELRTSDGRA